MSEALELIEGCERKTGQRIDNPNSDAMTMLFGTMARIMNDTPESDLTSKDDFAVGVLVQHQISEEGQRQKQSKQMLEKMLSGGLSPDDIKAIAG